MKTAKTTIIVVLTLAGIAFGIFFGSAVVPGVSQGVSDYSRCINVDGDNSAHCNQVRKDFLAR